MTSDTLPRIVNTDKKISFFHLQETSLPTTDEVSVCRSSEGLGWRGIAAALTREKPHECIHRPMTGLWIALPLNHTDLQRTIGKTMWREKLNTSRSVLTPPGETPRDIVLNETKAFHLFIRSSVLEEVAASLSFKRLAIAPAFGAHDMGLAYLLRATKQLLLEPSANQLQSEYLAQLIAAHVLNRYQTDEAQPVPPRDCQGLTAKQLRNVNDFIAANLTNSLTLKEMAAAIGMSRSLFVQRFGRSTQQSPHRFVMAMRVKRAQEMLEKAEFSLAEIAAICGFSDQSHMASVFKRFVGVLPRQYRHSFK